MTKKQWLSRGYLLNEYINTLLKEQARAKSDALLVTPQYAGDKVQILSLIHISAGMDHYRSYPCYVYDHQDAGL